MSTTQIKPKDILYTYKEGGVTVLVCKPRWPRKTVTAKPKGSTKHCGRTNAYGQRV